MKGVTAASSAPWRKVDSDVVHRTPWFVVRRDAVVRPDGGSDVYQHVIAPGAVTVLAIDRTDRVAMTRQWIYTHGSTQWRLRPRRRQPAGRRPPGVGRGDRAARREVGPDRPHPRRGQPVQPR